MFDQVRIWNMFLAGCFLLAVLGCSPTVQEDRSINYSSQGTEVALQHGKDGVFVASSDGQSLQKIFDSAEALAVSSPLWSPVDRRLIFTTAEPIPDEESVQNSVAMEWEADPEGRMFRPQAIVYTCWLREEAIGDQPVEPLALFTARCDHPGYVAANLAVRWHPDGDRILFIDQTADEDHGVSLFEFDLASGAKRSILDHHANALIFDWSPSGAYLTCSLLGIKGNRSLDGIWIKPDDGKQGREVQDWWRVPESGWQMPMKTVAMLDRLRATKPTWSEDENHFAFGSLEVLDNQDVLRSIYRADVASRTSRRVHQTESTIRDLRWQPRSLRLAFVEGSRPGSLRIIDDEGGFSSIDNGHDVRHFAGWNHNGKKLAYVSPILVPEDHVNWALLFPSVPAARDRVYVADGQTAGSPQLVQDEVRITFPQWSPTKNELSLWGTFAPTHRSWLSMFVPWALGPGDPAAILDIATGRMSWMAVNPHEQSQVGHYYLLQGDYETAWQWYERASSDRQPSQPISLADLGQLMRQRQLVQDPTFFEYYCLSKLGRAAEADKRLQEFRNSLTLKWDEDEQTPILGIDISAPETKTELKRLIGFLTPLIQSAYMTEVFLSLHAEKDGAAFFEQQRLAAKNDTERFASLVCQCQLLLAAGSYDAYADLVLVDLLPLLSQMIDPRWLSSGTFGFGDSSNSGNWIQTSKQMLLVAGGGMTMLPLASPEFHQTASNEQVRDQVSKWEAFAHQAADNDLSELAADLSVHAMLQRLDDPKIVDVRKRIEASSLVTERSATDVLQDLDALVQQIRAASVMFSVAP